jgi:His/Glu/Gln/Arg/opine family amino acid ABC transporter permease subunit
MIAFGVTLKWGYVWGLRGSLLHGLLVAVEVAGLSLLLSVILGVMLAVMRRSPAPVSWIASLYINVFRGVPVVVTAVWVYFGVAEVLSINFTIFEAAVISLVLLYSAFISEIYRSALEAIPRGQNEAGMALGMARTRIFLSVVLPQATKIAVPNIGSMMIGMIKDTSVMFTIGLVDLFAVTQNDGATSYQYFTLYTAAAIIYIAVAFIVDFAFRTIEKTMQTPPRGPFAPVLRSRKTRRINEITARFEAAGSTGTI